MTRTANLSTWLLRGTYPRLYVPIVLIILLVSGVRYHYLLQAETGEVHRHAAAELRRASDYLLPRLATTPTPDADAIASILHDGITHLSPGGAVGVCAAGYQWYTQIRAPWRNKPLYFKAGAYIQDNEGPSDEGGRVTFFHLNSAHR